MSESIIERAQNICSVGKSVTYPDMTSSRYVRHTMGELLAALTASLSREKPKQVTKEENMVSGREKFGAYIRREREGREIGLREMAKMIGVSPTYLSKVERDEFPPPAEDKVKAIAKILVCDIDDLLARAGRVSTDISDIIKRHPVELAALLRTTKGLTAVDIARLARQAQKVKDE